MSILFLAKSNISLTLRPAKCGAWILFSWKFFKCYMSYWQDSCHLYLSWEYTCYVFSVCLCNRWKIYVCFELEYSKYFLLGSCSHWYLLQIYLFLFHMAHLINNKVKSNHLNRKTFNCFFDRINHCMPEFRQNWNPNFDRKFSNLIVEIS